MPTTEPAGWIRRVVALCAERPGLLAVVVASSVSTIAVVALGPLLTREAVNDAVAGRLGGLGWLAGALALIAVLDFAGNVVRRDTAGRLSLWVQHTLRERVFESIQRLDGPGQDTLRTGQVVSRTNSDLQQLHALLQMCPVPISVLTYYAVGLAVMLWMSPAMTAVVVVVIGLLGLTAWHTRRRVFAASADATDELAGVTERVRGVLAQVAVVKSHAAEAREVRWLDAASRRLFRVRVAAAVATARPGATMLALPALGQVAVLCLGGWSVATGRLDLGTFVAFAGYVAMLTGPTRVLASFLVIAQRTRASAERVLTLLDTRPEMRDGDADLPPVDGLELAGVHFGYTPETPVLRGVDLTVEPGETVAVVGASGSGKSTLSLLVPRFYDPTAGSVRLGPRGARRDVADCRLADLRDAVGVVFEESFLFAGTVRDNIAYGHPEAGDADVRAAARAAGADDFVGALPHGYGSVLGERGGTLSGGQRQRLALARALLGRPRLLVLDDATSAVDAATEAGINRALREHTADGRMLLVIARRRSTLELADRVVVLDRGAVVDTGTREELEERCPVFRALLAGSDDSLEELETGDPWPEPATPAARPEVPESVLPPRAATAAVAEEPSRVRTMVAGAAPLFAVALVLVLVETAAAVGISLLVQRGIDQGVTAGRPSALVLVAAAAVLLVLAGWAAHVGQTIVSARASEAVQHVVRVRSYARILRLTPRRHEQEGDALLSRMTVDVDALARFLQNGLAASTVSLATMVGIATAMVVLDPGLALVALASLPVVVAVSVVYRRVSSPAYARARTEIGRVNGSLLEKVAGLRVVQAHGRQQDEAARFRALSDDHRATRARAQRYLALYFPFLTLCAELSYAAVLLVGARQVGLGEVTPGVLAAFLLLIGQLYGPIQQLSGVVDSLQQATASSRRIDELMALPDIEPLGPADPAPAAALGGDLVVEDLGFAYADDLPPALQDVDLRVPAGTSVAVVGPSGAGKTTLVNVLAGLYPAGTGRVGLGDTDLATLPLDERRRRVALVAQDVALFDGDVAQNIRYARPEATDADVHRSASAVGALGPIRALPRGFRTPVRDGGTDLSAGQRQLVALARAELVDADLVVLDEATARLDRRAEERLLDAVTTGPRRRTAVVVAHRLTTAARCDQVVVLERGRVVERGSHADLLAAGGAYASLWRASEEPATAGVP